jgi:folate-binding protein YgfZ
MTAAIALLADRAVLSVSGEDRVSFLQGLVTADVTALRTGEAVPAALLTPQGKILFLFLLMNAGDRYLIDCPATQADDLLKRLTFYKLRTKVTLARESDLAVATLLDATGTPREAMRFPDPRWRDLGDRLIAPAAAFTPVAAGNANEYRARRLKAGVAEGEEVSAAGLFPHEANLDQTGGVSFTKGCYVGQEVVSRMEHRATVRSRLVRVSGPAVEAGASIVAHDRAIGEVLAAADREGVALVRLDRLASARADGVPVTVRGEPVELAPPAGVRFTLDPPPEAAAS